MFLFSIAPLNFEEFHTSTHHPVYNGTTSGKFLVSCVVSASEVNQVDIWHQNIIPGENDFTRIENDEYMCDNGCKYGLEYGVLVAIGWRASEKELLTCEEVTQYDGIYQCSAEYTLLENKYHNTSNQIVVNTHCTYWATSK